MKILSKNWFTEIYDVQEFIPIFFLSFSSITFDVL